MKLYSDISVLFVSVVMSFSALAQSDAEISAAMNEVFQYAHADYAASLMERERERLGNKDGGFVSLGQRFSQEIQRALVNSYGVDVAEDMQSYSFGDIFLVKESSKSLYRRYLYTNGNSYSCRFSLRWKQKSVRNSEISQFFTALFIANMTHEHVVTCSEN